MPSDRVLIIGGGPSGIEAARGLADLGTPVTIVEARERLGGMPIAASYAALTPNFDDAEEAIDRMIAPLLDNRLVDIRVKNLTSAEPSQRRKGLVGRDMLKVLVLFIQEPDVVVFCIAAVFPHWKEYVVNDAFVFISLSGFFLLTIK